MRKRGVMMMASKRNRMRCDQCEAMMINGVFCHETGCPNMRKWYDAESGEWRVNEDAERALWDEIEEDSSDDE